MGHPAKRKMAQNSIPDAPATLARFWRPVRTPLHASEEDLTDPLEIIDVS
jgi:hypothetical protein